MRSNSRPMAAAIDLPSDVLPTPGGPDEAEDRAARVGLELAHREELEDPVLDLLDVVVVAVEHPARLLQVEVVVGGHRPRAGSRATRGSRGSRRARPTAAAAARSAAARARPASWRARAARRPRSARAAPAASASISSTSPSSSWIALSCWRRKNSRWPLSISDSTCDWICEPIEISSSSRASSSERRRSRLATSSSSSSSWRSSVLMPQRPGDHVRQLGRVLEVGDRELQLLGQVGDLLDDLREGGLDVAEQRLELGRGLDQVGQLGRPWPPGTARSGRTPRCCTRWAPCTRIRSVPSGTLIMRATVPATPTR